MIQRLLLLVLAVVLPAACGRERTLVVPPWDAATAAAPTALPRPLVGPDGASPADGGLCGVPERPCCPGNVCGAGGCCVEGRCFQDGLACVTLEGVCKRGSCGAGACGGVDQPCCSRGSCTAAGTFCLGGTCATCGGFGQPCCPGQGCLAPGTGCSIGMCLPCGEPGQRCCLAGGPGFGGTASCNAGGCCSAGRCIVPGASCGREGSCTAGACDSCGKKDQACCQGSRCDGADLGCDATTQNCVAPCGGAGQACCSGNPCAEGLSCVTDRSIVTLAGAPAPRVCRPCGAPGQACCSGQQAAIACQAGGCCVANVCLPAGATCITVIGPAGMCVDGRCTGCGDDGQSCCPQNRLCNNDSAICASVPMDMSMPPVATPPGAQPPRPRTCQRCGEPGQPCCPVNRCNNNGCCARAGSDDGGTCVAPGGQCLKGGACAAAGCGTCGKPGQPCCDGGCTAPNTTCKVIAGYGGRCMTCGARGEPCCADPTASGYIAAQVVTCFATNLTCRNGFCMEF